MGTESRTVVVGAVLLCAATLTQAQSALPSYFNEFLAPSRVLESSAPTTNYAPLNLFKSLEGEGLQLTGLIAARNAEDATDYRVYVGLGHKRELGSLTKITSRAFYGTGTFDGLSGAAAPLPEDVRANGNLVGDWVGADWKLQTQVSSRYSFQAGVQYRQQLAHELVDLNGLMSRARTTADETLQPAREVGVVTYNNLALTSDLALKVRMRYDEDVNTPDSEVELAYEKAVWERNRVRLAAYRKDAHGLLAMTRAPGVDTTGFEVGVERSSLGGTRARVSYAWQQTSDALAATSNSTLGQHLTKFSLDVPILPDRLSTSFEIQRLDVVGTVLDESDRRVLIGNLTVASAAVSSNTRVSFGMRNLFGAKEPGATGPLLSAIPPDGRSLRLDLTRTL